MPCTVDKCHDCLPGAIFGQLYLLSNNNNNGNHNHNNRFSIALYGRNFMGVFLLTMVTGYQTQTASNDRHFYYCRHPFNTTNNQSNSCGKITANILSDVGLYWRIFPGT